MPPNCPEHGIEMIKYHITQGELDLGYFWGCPIEECSEAEDYEPQEEETEEQKGRLPNVQAP